MNPRVVDALANDTGIEPTGNEDPAIVILVLGAILLYVIYRWASK